MSYLSLPRLTFSGLFEADVNTVNNDVRNFDVATFKPRFQTPQEPALDGKGKIYNGWWNPNGSNAFRLLGCAVTGGAAADGTAVTDDLALTLRLRTQDGRTSAKIVDLDPQFQFASAIWGMRVTFAVAETVIMSASFGQTSFRDIYFGRVANVLGSSSASARFTGFLDDLVWNDQAWAEGMAASPLMNALRSLANANNGRLSMSLMTYGYSKAPGTNSFTVGSVVGTVGPWLRGEPLTFGPGRRFAPLGDKSTPFAAASGLGYMNGAVSADGKLLSLDFGNSLPMALAPAEPLASSPIMFSPLGPLQIVVLNVPDTVSSGPKGLILSPSASDGNALAPEQFASVGTLQNYDIDWLRRTGGIVDLKIPDAARSTIGDHPIAILRGSPVNGEWTIGLRETVGGIWVRADDFVQRLDAAASGWVDAAATLFAMRYGEPYAGALISVTLQQEDHSSGGAGGDEVCPPQAKIPAINVPTCKIKLPPNLTADQNGVAKLAYAALNPGNPRGYLDGQIYQFGYTIAALGTAPNVTGPSPMPIFEWVTVHVRDAFIAPGQPEWGVDIAPILVQYGNLYPIMSHGLFSFSDNDTVVAHARLLYLAFTRSIEDPNYMPVTRDMSAGKVRMMIDWLQTNMKDVSATYGELPTPPKGSTLGLTADAVITRSDHPTHLSATTARTAAQALGPGNDGKTTAVRNYLDREAVAQGNIPC